QLTLIGNVIFQGTTQQNGSQIIAVYNDAGDAGLTLNVTLAYNTFVGLTGGHAALVHLSNADGTPMNAELDDNLIVGAAAAVNAEDSSTGHVTGTHNWLTTGTTAIGLMETIFGPDPMFKDAANEDFTLAASSTAIGAASQTIGPTLSPVQEYYRNETVARMTRARASARDIGAFESTTTGDGTGPNGAGGSSAGDGGSPATGGVEGTSGAGGSKTGGVTGTAGSGTGGRNVTTGAGGTRTGGHSGTRTGGVTGTAGQATGAGGTHGGGASGATAGAPGGGGEGGGCSCGVAGGSPGRGAALLLIAALILRRRRD
ncbi:MAG: MYXO-CTERM sorting domain-containing protein, partial [Verrucomicrobiota bacterium]